MSRWYRAHGRAAGCRQTPGGGSLSRQRAATGDLPDIVYAAIAHGNLGRPDAARHSLERARAIQPTLDTDIVRQGFSFVETPILSSIMEPLVAAGLPSAPVEAPESR